MDSVTIRLSPGLQLRLWAQYLRAKPIIGEDTAFSTFLRDVLVLGCLRLEATENHNPSTPYGTDR